MQTSNRKHLLILIEVYCGPTMTFVVRQLEELKKTFDITLISNRRENEMLYKGSPILVPHDIVSRLIGKVLRIFGFAYCIAPLKMQRQIESIHKLKKIDGAICHFGPAGLQVAKILEKLNIPQSVIIHGYDGSSLLRNHAYLRQISRCKRAKWIFASNSLRVNFLKHFPSLTNYVNVHLGINLPSLERNSRISIAEKVGKNEKIFFFQAANFVEKKGHEYTIKAFKNFLDFYPNAELLLAGSGELLIPMQELVKSLGIELNVKFLGHLSPQNVLNYMVSSDIFVHHSVTASNGDQESIPTVIMEAMSYGMPVISTYHSGIPELIESGVDGVLVQERDIGQYYDAMVRLLFDGGVISSNAINKINRDFSFKKNLSNIVNFTLN